MLTFPTSPVRVSPNASPDDRLEPAFWLRVSALEEAHRRLWWRSLGQTPPLGARFDRRRQSENERQTRAFIDGIAETVRACPQATIDRRAAGDSIKARIREYATNCLGWSGDEQQLFFSEDAFRVTQEFAREARRFDANLPSDALFQAMRNVWIMNGLQILLGRPLELTPAVFAYSLLYPYTDNPLDVPETTDADGTTKRARNERLARRLRGLPRTPPLDDVDAHEHKVDQLVTMIEGQYPRRDFPQVYLGLRAIHRGQCRSLDQHGRQSPYETDILGISLAKGGSSVLADGCLVAGALSDGDAEFCYGYGALLQLLDDLQDVGPDRAAGHMTLFSQTAEAWPLDRTTTQLLAFMDGVLDSGRAHFDAPRFAGLFLAIRRNCIHLLVQAVAANRKLFTSDFVRKLEPYSPLPFSAMANLTRQVEKRHAAIKKIWTKQGVHLDSVCDMLDS